MKQNKWWYTVAGFLAITIFAWFIVMTDKSDGLTGKQVYSIINGEAYYIIIRLVALLFAGFVAYHLFFTEEGKNKLVEGKSAQLLIWGVFVLNILAWFVPVAVEKADPLLKILNP